MKQSFHTADWWREWSETTGSPWLVGFEQACIDSSKHRLCINCGEPGAVEHKPGKNSLVKSWGYFMCQDCHDYYEGKRGEVRAEATA